MTLYLFKVNENKYVIILQESTKTGILQKIWGATVNK